MHYLGFVNMSPLQVRVSSSQSPFRGSCLEHVLHYRHLLIATQSVKHSFARCGHLQDGNVLENVASCVNTELLIVPERLTQ